MIDAYKSVIESSIGTKLEPKLGYYDYDPSFDYLILNTELDYDFDLTGFEINSIRTGCIDLAVNLNIL